MADNYLIRIQFVQKHDLSDWHETWYTEAINSEAAVNKAMKYVSERRKTLALSTEIRRVTASNVTVFRDVNVLTGNFGRIVGDGKAPAAEVPDYPDMGWLCQFFSTDKIWRHLCMRGLPDNLLGGPDAVQGRIAFTNPFKDLLRVIKDEAQFKIRNVAPLPAKVKIFTHILAESTVTFNTATTDHGLEVGDTVIIRGVKGPKLNGTYRVYARPTAFSFVIQKRGVEPRDILDHGTCQKRVYQYSQIGAGELLRVSTHRTRVPFVGRRGRSTRRNR